MSDTTTIKGSTNSAPANLLERVRKLLAKAEDESVTPPEAQALTAKAAELMAKYGIDRALLAQTRPDSDLPADKMIEVPNPWGRVKSHLLCGIAAAMRCQAIMHTGQPGMVKIHLFGYTSDLERVDLLYTSLLVQMWHGMVAAEVPEWTSSPKAWRRSWLLGFGTGVIAKVREAETAAETAARADTVTPGSTGVALVLADRRAVIGQNVKSAYPRTRSARVTYSGSGYSDGYANGQRADIGGGKLGRSQRSLTGR